MTSDEELQSFFNLSADIMVVFDLEGKIRRVNPAATRVLGWSERELVNKTYKDFMNEEDCAKAADTIAKLKDGKIGSALVNQWACANKSFKWLSWTASVNHNGKIYAIARDVTAQKRRDEKERERYERMVFIDPLTDLLNRRGLEEALSHTAKRVFVVLIDLDDFKDINTQCGHSMGDFALKDVAYMIRNAVRPADIAARIGGDEFMVLLDKVNKQEALTIAERIRGNIEIVRVHRLDGTLMDVSASIGVLSIDTKEINTTTNALQQVESLLKKAKTNGKNRVCFS